MLPYSRLVSPPGDSVAQEPSEILSVPRDDLPAMIRECHEITSILVHKMLDRSRVFTSSGLLDEKMLSLGKLSAGLTHELNNPASAIERSAAQLQDRLQEADQATRALGASGLTAPQLATIEAVRASCVAARVHGVLSPIQQVEREDAIADWLANHGIDEAVAGPLAEQPSRSRPWIGLRRLSVDLRCTLCSSGRQPDARFTPSWGKSGKPQDGSPVWSPPSRDSPTWIRLR